MRYLAFRSGGAPAVPFFTHCFHVSVFLIVFALPEVTLAGTFAAFGPETFERERGKPERVTRSFSVQDPNASYTISVVNGDGIREDGKEDRKERVTDATIKLNGKKLFGPGDFSKRVRGLTKAISLKEANRLDVKIEGDPHSELIITIIGIDDTPPTITASATPPPNAAEWNQTDVVVTYTCSDGTSGVATCPDPTVVTTEGAQQVVSGMAIDRAGNTATASVGLNIDKTPPSLSHAIAPAPNADGWNQTAPTVGFAATDALSGVATVSPPVTVTTEGKDQIVTGTATDQAGNTATASVVVSLDKTAPVVTITSPSDGAQVTASPVAVTATVSDALSGMASVTCNGNQAVLIERAVTCSQSLSLGSNAIVVQGVDLAGNTTPSTITVALLPTSQPPAGEVGEVILRFDPGGVQVNTTSTIRFGASYSGGTVNPTSVVLDEVTATGSLVLQVGPMLDDGLDEDLIAGDSLYTQTASLTAGPTQGVRYFRATALLPGGESVRSSIEALPLLPFAIGFVPVDRSFIITDPDTGQRLYCNQILAIFKAGTPTDLIEAAAASVNGTIVGVEPILRMYQLSIPCNGTTGVSVAVETLQLNASVDSAEAVVLRDLAAFQPVRPDDSGYPLQWAPPRVHAPEAWAISSGFGIVVAVIDSGVDANHKELEGKLRFGGDFVGNFPAYRDNSGHGTHLAGIIAAQGNNATGIAGMAWGARILVEKVCENDFMIPESQRIYDPERNHCSVLAIVSAIKDAALRNAQILNVSIDGEGRSRAEEDAVKFAQALDSLVVVSAGNDSLKVGPDLANRRYPCAYPYTNVLCVGATGQFSDVIDDPRWPSSNHGEDVRIAAPGENVYSTVPSWYPVSGSPGYASLSGTSQATALVSGIAAMVWAAHPELSSSGVRQRLVETAKPLVPDQGIGPRVEANCAVYVERYSDCYGSGYSFRFGANFRAPIDIPFTTTITGDSTTNGHTSQTTTSLGTGAMVVYNSPTRFDSSNIVYSPLMCRLPDRWVSKHHEWSLSEPPQPHPSSGCTGTTSQRAWRGTFDLDSAGTITATNNFTDQADYSCGSVSVGLSEFNGTTSDESTYIIDLNHGGGSFSQEIRQTSNTRLTGPFVPPVNEVNFTTATTGSASWPAENVQPPTLPGVNLQGPGIIFRAYCDSQ